MVAAAAVVVVVAGQYVEVGVEDSQGSRGDLLEPSLVELLLLLQVNIKYFIRELADTDLET